MRNVFLILFIGLFSNVSHSQNAISLGLCDDIPLGFYQEDYHEIQIENGMGYCTSPEKILDYRLANFKNLESLIFQHSPQSANYQYYTLPEEISELHKLRTLKTNIPNNEVFSLSHLTHLGLAIRDSASVEILEEEGFYKLHLLEVLDINMQNGMSKDYEVTGISGLKNLRVVHLYNPNQQLTNEVLANPNIEELTIQYSKGLDFDFSQMLNLKKLKLDMNELAVFPPSIFKLKQLQELNVSSNRLSSIGSEIGEMKNLKVLILGNNNLTNLSAELNNCTELTKLSLDHNSNLKNLFENIGNLNKLENLNISHCGLSELPKSLEECVMLKTLDAQHNELTKIEFSFGDMLQMDKLYLQYNQIASIDSSLFSRATLTRLDLSRNKLTILHTSIGKMKALEDLDIHTNVIEELPEDIGLLRNLEELGAYQNAIKELPKSIIQLKKLRLLYLGDNKLTSLPEGFGKLSLIQALELQNNPFLVFPTAIYAISNLDRIWVSPEQAALEGFVPSKKNPVIIITN